MSNMRHAAPSPDRRALITFGVMAVLVVVAVLELARLGKGDERADNRSVSETVPAPTTTTAPPPTTRGPLNYQVQRGDTLTVIATRFGVTIDDIVATNHLADEDRLSEGQLIVVPSPPPVALVVTPATTSTGRSVQLKLAGARPSENITFQVNSPTGSFTGPSHGAAADGTVTTTYSVSVDAPIGTYAVTAKGDRGTTAQATFRVDPAVPAT
jgi:LysM repeat protein